MKKYLSIAIILMMMASPVVFTSCDNDDPMEEVESPETKLDVWTEPYHIMGANVDEIKSYMAQSMKRYRQVAETSGDNIQLTFMTGQGSEGVLYSFSSLDGSLYSVIDTERSVNRGLVIDYQKKHYTLVSVDEASLQYCFTKNVIFFRTRTFLYPYLKVLDWSSTIAGVSSIIWALVALETFLSFSLIRISSMSKRILVRFSMLKSMKKYSPTE